MTPQNNETENTYDYIEIAGIPVLNTTSTGLVEVIHRRHQQLKKTILFFANSNFIVTSRVLFQTPSPSIENVLIANDGVALNIACKLIHGKAFRDNLNGTDFSPFFLKHYPEKLTIFLLGAKPEVVIKAKNYLSLHFPAHSVVGMQDGYFDRADNADVVDKINASGANVLFVAMGNPMQEKWILAHQHLLKPTYIFGVGALFDFWSGSKLRAPKLVQKLRLEWLFRLCQEPQRLMKRYTVDIIGFLYIAIKESKPKN